MPPLGSAVPQTSVQCRVSTALFQQGGISPSVQGHFPLPNEVQAKLRPNPTVRSLMSQQSSNQNKMKLGVTAARRKQFLTVIYSSHRCVALTIFLPCMGAMGSRWLHIFNPKITKSKNRLLIKKKSGKIDFNKKMGYVNTKCRGRV